MKESENPILKLKPTQNKIYLMIERYLGTFIVFVFLSFISFQQEFFKFALLVTGIYVLYAIASIIITTIKWKKVYYVFYENKIVIIENAKKQEKFYYRDLEDIMFMQSRIQKMFNIGYLRLKKNDGNVLTKNLDLKPLDNFNDVMAKMTRSKLIT